MTATVLMFSICCPCASDNLHYYPMKHCFLAKSLIGKSHFKVKLRTILKQQKCGMIYQDHSNLRLTQTLDHFALECIRFQSANRYLQRPAMKQHRDSQSIAFLLYHSSIRHKKNSKSYQNCFQEIILELQSVLLQEKKLNKSFQEMIF